jgi:tRNA-specific 2-thiouridylase
MTGTKGKVLLAMSGGVDSSVAAALLQRQGYDVIGCFMRLGSPGDVLQDAEETEDAIRITHHGCCSIHDANDARHVAAELGIPFYVLNFRRDFGRIIDYFVAEYNAGRTPNPCIRCNDWLKFGRLAEYARSIDADFVATGHYARVGRVDGQPALMRGKDRAKDQSYVLFGVQKRELQRMLMPIGEMTKAQVRRIAAELALPVHDKPDSQEICFVSSDDYANVVAEHSPQAIAPGPLLDTQQRIIGEHRGHQRYTIGQRRGLGVALGHPIYVVSKDAESNTVVVGGREDLACRAFMAGGVNWLIDPPNDGHPVQCHVQVRSSGCAVAGRISVDTTDRLHVELDEPIDAVAPGQAAVCYVDDRVIAGGWIEHAGRVSSPSH